ncbi:28S ribosomal protein S9, mitochondrial [Nasonia vitripennis]|uniref:Small ribosomal subunit protein uS9m n=1 Tax=Nasonia vitripennis TaxID=7425 RepID=A0A7M7LM20_NASVI|nr:28S ribosomal protein S9, mitochondrial [Nasonia vitripennis]
MSVSSSIFSQLTTFRNVVTSRLLNRIVHRMNNVSLYSTATAAQPEMQQPASTEKQPRKISKAMIAYLERAKAHDTFIRQEQEDYNIGKRHLANMMGEDPEHFTQADVERAIEYLFPSGLFDKAARPVMKPPQDMFPPKKAAEFDESGRPFHSLFYTTKPNYYQALHDIYDNLLKLNDLEDKMIRKGIPPDQHAAEELQSSDWVNHEQLQKILLEEVGDIDYEYFLSSIKRLTDHPYANHAKDYLMKFRMEKRALTHSFEIPQLEYDEEGRPFITVPDCMRKEARGSVTVKGKGTGKIIINGKPLINYFIKYAQSREQVIFPLQFTGMMGEVDIEATVRNGGPSGQAGAIRWGIAWGLRSFVNTDMVEKMRIAGLLTRDWRRHERKKPGQAGARRKFTWKKR